MTGKKAIIILSSILIFCLMLSLVLYIITLNLKIKYLESHKLNTVETIIFTNTIKELNNTAQKAMVAFTELNDIAKDVDKQVIHEKKQLFELDKWVIRTKNINGVYRDIWQIDNEQGYRLMKRRIAQEGYTYLDFKGVYN